MTDCLPFSLSPGTGTAMDIGSILRIIVLILSAGVMLFGVSVIAGFLVPVFIPDQFRILTGIVILLYGAYRFVTTLYRKKDSE
ncbi:MAG: hypothetical protein OEV30_06680 [Ignavibacteria bacterium]|nr:hypothetical protein [Ignavibacteria bacterium]